MRIPEWVGGPAASLLVLSEIAQLAEQLTVNQRVAGSSPALGARDGGPPIGGPPSCQGPVAQWSERGTHNPLVAGSIPAWPTRSTRDLCCWTDSPDASRRLHPTQIQHPSNMRLVPCRRGQAADGTGHARAVAWRVGAHRRGGPGPGDRAPAAGEPHVPRHPARREEGARRAARRGEQGQATPARGRRSTTSSTTGSSS